MKHGLRHDDAVGHLKHKLEIEIMAQNQNDYSDDDLDALPDSTFQQLQENAFESTQQAARGKPLTPPPAARPPKRTPAVLAQGLERFSVGGAYPSFMSQRASELAQLPSSDYGDLDDEMLDGEIYDTAEEPGANAIQASRAASLPAGGESPPRKQWPNQRYGTLPKHIHSNPPQAPAVAQMRNEFQGNHINPKIMEATTFDDDAVRPSRRPDIDALNAQILEVCSPRASSSIT